LTRTYRTHDIFKHYVDINVITKVEEAIDCPTCKLATIAKLDLNTNQIKLFDFDPYYQDHTQIPHKHPADASTRSRVMARVATNKRLLEERDPGDHHYPSRRERN
jgi:hypothetical protein